MIRKLTSKLFALGVLAFVLGTMAHMENKTNRAVEADIKSRVVKVESHDKYHGGQGTGTIVAPHLILTNAHLFPNKWKGRLEIVFRQYDDDSYKSAIVISSDTKTDLALLFFPGPDHAKPVKLTRHWRIGEPLIILGNPRTGDFITGHTFINAYSFTKREDGYIRPMIQYDCGVGAPGFSGSGVYNTNGEMIGIFELGELPENLLQKILLRAANVEPYTQQCFAIPSGELLDRMENK
jgi:S1-C subfamily serine protease